MFLLFISGTSRIHRICTKSLLMMLPTLLMASLAASFTWWLERKKKGYFGMNGNCIQAQLEHHKLIKTSVCIDQQNTHLQTKKNKSSTGQLLTTLGDWRFQQYQNGGWSSGMPLCLSNYVPSHVGHWSPCKVLVPPAMVRSSSKECSCFGKKRSAATTLRLRLQNWNAELSICFDLSVGHQSLQFINSNHALWHPTIDLHSSNNLHYN